jgi:hypothetical protein
MVPLDWPVESRQLKESLFRALRVLRHSTQLQPRLHRLRSAQRLRRRLPLPTPEAKRQFRR